MIQISNPKLALANYRIHGLGVFAKEPIHEVELVVTFSGPVFTEAPLYPEVDNLCEIRPGYWLGPSGYEDDAINHSCDPNCELDVHSLELRALLDIPPGEEITYDYAGVIHDDWVIECTCGAADCRGYIRKRPIRQGRAGESQTSAVG